MGQVREGRKVLIVEDEVDLATTCARYLRKAGFVPLVASNEPEAIALLDREQPDLVFADLHLPEGDGLAVLRHACQGTRKVPVVIFTAYASGASRSQALREGATLYLPKPFSVEQLRAAAEQALARHVGGPE